jgi:uncharacterized membrane protein
MNDNPAQQQTVIDDVKEAPPQQTPEYDGGYRPQSGYQQQEYSPNQPYPPYYQNRQQQQYSYRPPYYTPTSGDVSPFERTSMGMKARTAGLLCYLFGWVGGLVFLLLERDNRFVRFHAMQSILFFGAISILEWVFGYFPFWFFGVGGALGLVSFIGWIVLMVAAHRGRYYKLPLIGDYAEKFANQIRV